MLGVTREIVIEGQCNSRSSLITRSLPIGREDFIECHEVNDLAERVKLRSEYIHRYGRNNLATVGDSGSEAMIDEHKTVSTDTCERSYCAAHRGRSQECVGNAAHEGTHGSFGAAPLGPVSVANALSQRSASAIQAESLATKRNRRSLPTAGWTNATTARPMERTSPLAIALA